MKQTIRKILSLISLSAALAGCSGSTGSRDTVHEDMKAAFEQSGLLSANIGIFSRTEEEGSVTYKNCGSGVIIEKKDGMYYALTSAHVVSAENAQPVVFTVNTEMKTESIPGMSNMTVLSRSAYETMYPAEKVFISTRDDLAVIRFACDEELAAVSLADADPQKDDRIMCIGNPQEEWFAVSYGKVTSGIEQFGELQGYPSNAMKHTAYIHSGSSGGAALNEQMQLCGITPGGSYSPDGKDFRYGVLIPVSEIRLCLEDWNR